MSRSGVRIQITPLRSWLGRLFTPLPIRVGQPGSACSHARFSAGVFAQTLTRAVAVKTPVVDLGTGCSSTRRIGVRSRELCWWSPWVREACPGRHPFSSLRVCTLALMLSSVMDLLACACWLRGRGHARRFIAGVFTQIPRQPLRGGEIPSRLGRLRESWGC